MALKVLDWQLAYAEVGIGLAHHVRVVVAYGWRYD